MSDPLRFSFEYGKPQPDRRPDPGQPLRILYLTDLGEASRSRAAASLDTRPIRAIDIDTFEDFLAAENPVARIGTDDPSDQHPEINIRDLEDLHPDQIYRNLPVFQDLKDLRNRLRSPATFEAASKELLAGRGAGPDGSGSDSASRVESDAETIERIFGKSAESKPLVADEGAGTSAYLSTLIRDAVASHVVAASDPRTDQYLDAVDAAACAQMRAILHDPGFQSLEAAWRCLDFLVSHVETDEELQILVWNVSKSELVDAMGPEGGPERQSLLHRRLLNEREDEPLSLIVSDVAFGVEAQDLRLLGEMGQIAGRAGALFLASVAPETFGAESWAHVVDAPDSMSTPNEDWTALRSSAVAHRIALVGPRFLLRSPYGSKLDPIDAFDFEELEDPAMQQDACLWGAPALIATVLIAQSFRDSQWDLHLSGNLELDDLPLVAFEADGVPQMLPCSETLLPERAADAVLRSGPIPLLGIRNRNAVRLAGFQSISNQTGGAAPSLGPFRT